MKNFNLRYYALPLVFVAAIFAVFFVRLVGADYESIIDVAQQSKEISHDKYDVKLSNGDYIIVACQQPSASPDAQLDSFPVLTCQVEKRLPSKLRGERLLNVSILETLPSVDYYKLSFESIVLPRVVNNLSDELKGPLERELSPLDVADLETTDEILVRINKSMWGASTSLKLDVDQNTLKGLVLSEIRKASAILKIDLERNELDRVGEITSKKIIKSFPVFDLRQTSNINALLFSGSLEYIILTAFFLALMLTLLAVFGHFTYHKTDVSWNESDVRIIGIKAGQLGATLTFLGLLGTLIGVYFTVTELGNTDFADELRKVFDQSSSFGAMGLSISTSVVGVGGSIIIWFVQSAFSLALGKDYFKED
ncbi:hypothetical protein [Vibrio barjaei]|uniref:hypothetical protein n=1 Tax=Vibrio barjaei TaxID=1676683 RepID=UPI0022834F0F|nr:hypothetical protein [Vibrio barjaei]MCY9870805.1 hypothetical protein [Vibrio barjaei]